MIRLGPEPTFIDDKIDVLERMQLLDKWLEHYYQVDEQLMCRLPPKPQLNTRQGQLRSLIIGIMRERAKLLTVKSPYEVSPVLIREVGAERIKQNLKRQYASMSIEQKLKWLRNLELLITPDARKFYTKLEKLRSYHAMGKRIHLLLSGPQGSGKTTLLRSLSAWYLPDVFDEYNWTPVAHVDAIDGDRTEKALLQAIAMSYGASPRLDDSPLVLIGHISGLFQSCGTELLLIDEIEALRTKIQKRRVVELVNHTRDVLVVGASVNSLPFRQDDDEIAGRFPIHYELKLYQRDPKAENEEDKNRLSPLLSLTELLIPVTGDSFLAEYEMTVVEGRKKEIRTGPAACIEELTGGKFQDIMLLLTLSAQKAIRANEPTITIRLLEDTWRNDIRSDDQNPDLEDPEIKRKN